MFTNRQLMTLLLPLFFEQFLSIFVGMADTVMVSSLGDAVVSGVSLVDMLCNVLITLLAALATGGAVVASQLLGAKRQDDACRVSNQLIMVTVGVAMMIAVFLLTLSQPLLNLLYSAVEPDVMRNAVLYLQITAISYPFIGLYNSGAALARAMNRSNVTLKMSIIANVINIAGNAFCIHGLHMGVEGAAIPTLISRVVSAVGMTMFLRNRDLQLHIVPKAWKPDGKMIREILHIGVPNGCENALFQLGRVLVVRVITGFGTVQIAANAVANTLDSIGCLPAQAINLGVVPVIGQCVGANDYWQVRHYSKKLISWAYLSMIVFDSLTILTLPWTLQLFNVTQETRELAKILICIHNGAAMFLWPLAFTLPNVLRAASDVKYTMVVSIASMAIFRIVFSYVLGVGLGWGAIGVWCAMLLDWLCRIAFFLWRYCGSKWESKARIQRN